MGLTRLWLIPQGAAATDGVYLSYPLTDLLRLLALESHRHQAIVVGEDLGTVPGGFRETLETTGLHGMRVLWFERAGQEFSPPSAWDHAAVAMTSTHDLAPVAGWWHGSDITTRVACSHPGIAINESDLLAERAADRTRLWDAFAKAGAAAGNAPAPDDTPPVVDAAIVFVARTDTPLCLLPIEDIVGQEEQPNLPGTIDEHPNWRRRLNGEAGSLLREPRTSARVDILAAERPRQ
jgi:4-alpha-glucanotransferase